VPTRTPGATASAIPGCGATASAWRRWQRNCSTTRSSWRADLGHWAKFPDSDKPNVRARLQQTLTHWQNDADLAGLRDKDAVAQLPAEEQEVCKNLWPRWTRS